MKTTLNAGRGLVAALVTAGSLAVLTAQIPTPGTLPGVEPLHDSGQDVTPAYEGWFRNPDGSFAILFGYFNRNLKETLDIPIGPNNRIEPGGPDQGQPTHFLPRRGWGMFTVNVPKNFGTGKITWTLNINGRTNAIPATLDSTKEIDALTEVTSGNTPPVIKFSVSGPSNQGPRTFYGPPITATVGKPVALDLLASDDYKGRSRNSRPILTISWSKYRGTGTVTFDTPRPDVEKDTGRAVTTATFKEPGEYILRAVANDSSGDGGNGFQCCWTNALVKVTVKP